MSDTDDKKKQTAMILYIVGAVVILGVIGVVIWMLTRKECTVDGDCSNKSGGKTSCDTKNSKCVKPIPFSYQVDYEETKSPKESCGCKNKH